MANPNTAFTFFNAASGTPVSGLPPFKMNAVYDIGGSNEASLYNSVYTEFAWLYGTDIVFIERETYDAEPVFGEFMGKAFTRGTPMRLFVEETDGWGGGGGDQYTKFGIEVTDECTIFCPKITFEQARPGLYPKYHDLIYVPKAKKLFEIKHIEDELPPAFYLLGNRSGYVFTCKTFVYDHSEIIAGDGIPEEIVALDKLILDVNNAPVYEEINKTETEKTNDPIQTIAHSGLLDNSEVDPLTGGQ